MDDQRLIARRMMDEYPVIIRKKNLYKNKNHKTFRGWAVRENTFSSPEKHKLDKELASEAERFLKLNDFAFLVGCQMD